MVVVARWWWELSGAAGSVASRSYLEPEPAPQGSGPGPFRPASVLPAADAHTIPTWAHDTTPTDGPISCLEADLWRGMRGENEARPEASLPDVGYSAVRRPWT